MNYKIESERLFLRQFQLDDAVAYHQMTTDKLVQEYVEYACSPTLEETIENIELSYSKCDFKHDYYLILEEKLSHKIVGAILATQGRDSSTIEVCALIHSNFRKNGYMTEALNAFIASLPQKTVLSFYIKKENIASVKTLGKIPGVKEIYNDDYYMFEYIV